MRYTCPNCKGEGRCIDGDLKYSCEWCLGNGKLTKDKLTAYRRNEGYLEEYEAHQSKEL
jgi:DnaJ-class molecular chaperone